MEEITLHLEEANGAMEKMVNRTRNELAKIRTGKATPSLLENIQVAYYGTMTPLNQVASVTTPDARTIFIKPWEKSLIPEVEKAILAANLGFTPQNDGQQVIITIPMLTEERRRQLMKQVIQECERGRVGIRGVRKETNEKINKIQGASEDHIRGAEEEVQKITNEFVKQIDGLLKSKESQIMTI